MSKLKLPVPPADYPFAYRDLPTTTGNSINGLGSREKTRPIQVFHNTGRGKGRDEVPYASLDMFFNLTNPWSMFWENLKGWWERRNAAGPVTRAADRGHRRGGDGRAGQGQGARARHRPRRHHALRRRQPDAGHFLSLQIRRLPGPTAWTARKCSTCRTGAAAPR